MRTKKSLPKLIAIVGPTAAGKTALAVRLAQKHRGAVINADSRQLYSQLNIGTAKPAFQKLIGHHAKLGPIYDYQDVAHYLFDVVSPAQTLTVAQYQRMANLAIKIIIAQGKVPFLTGGTGLYIKAVLENLNFPRVPPQPKLRLLLGNKSLAELVLLLKKMDPESAAVVQLSNRRRVIRALEVFITTGSSFAAQRTKKPPKYAALVLGLVPPKTTLTAVLEKRVQEEMERGLEDEVRRLAKAYGWSGVLGHTIKYQEWPAYLAGRITKDQLFKKLVRADRAYARRQMTWFKRQAGVHWIKHPDQAEKLVSDFLKSENGGKSIPS